MSRGYIDLVRWLDNDAAPLDPAAMQYRARLADEDARDCTGCLFRGQASKVCKAAASGRPARRHK